ncbi:DUF2252 family protein [Streptomyces sp. NPDC048723]|uniref:DUF2252 family protein n=1 Tax=Streptomyces sp. NPDC048723 TaxID=3365589 RepID=UPI003716305B
MWPRTGGVPEPDRQLCEGGGVRAARKVVGVGSVGTRCFIALFTGRDTNDPLFLQIKEATASVLEPRLGASPHEHAGHRVVHGQRILQTASDIFLGGATGPEGRHFYWRQLREMKGSADVASMGPRMLRATPRCAAASLPGRARTGDPIAIAAYLGGKDSFDRAIAVIAARYAEQSLTDHAALRSALTARRLPSVPPGP